MEDYKTRTRRGARFVLEAPDMNTSDDLYPNRRRYDKETARRKTTRPIDEDKKEKRDPDPYPVTYHPNILPPTEFMAIGLYSH